MDVRVSADPAGDAARYIVDRLGRAIDESGSASLAVSGGSTAPALFAAMRDAASATGGHDPIEWDRIGVWQVDERIAPDGDADRNAGQLSELSGVVHPMPVNRLAGADADAGAVAGAEDVAAVAEYAAVLPARFDVVHLGLGDDGHTASWAPSPHPDVGRTLTTTDAVFTISAFNGRRRMTLGVDVVNAAGVRVVLVIGANKADAVGRWIDGHEQHRDRWIDETLPVAALEPVDTIVFLDHAAAGALRSADASEART
ncbi:6-phosphogluconolactonase [Ilumatobacter sp.]|uniref:6-phosphogluconolactonase n=1 Tax=Ilumatobacter sp. TaxID=1967498 RepID=UPI003C45C8CF